MLMLLLLLRATTPWRHPSADAAITTDAQQLLLLIRSTKLRPQRRILALERVHTQERLTELAVHVRGRARRARVPCAGAPLPPLLLLLLLQLLDHPLQRRTLLLTQ